MESTAIITIKTAYGKSEREIATSSTLDESCTKADAIIQVFGDYFLKYAKRNWLSRLIRPGKLDEDADLFLDIVKIIEGE